MIFTDAIIKDEIENGNIIAENVHPDNIGNSSVDVRLGKWVKKFAIDEDRKQIVEKHRLGDMFIDFRPINDSGKVKVIEPLYLEHIDIDLEKEGTVILEPGEFMLAETYEYIGMARHCKNIVAKVTDKSTYIRWNVPTHRDAGYIDIGNALNVTLEIHNHFKVPVRLHYKAHIAQIIFQRCEGICENPYDGKYKNSKQVEVGK